MEIILAIFLVIWVILFYIEKAASKKRTYGQYAWIAHATRPILFFVGFGLFLIFVGTDWHNPLWERIAGFICISIGFGMSCKAFIYRKKIQEGLESGRIKSSVA